MADLQQDLAAFRAVREELERAVLPLATSLDGRRFSFQASLHGLDLPVGGYVALEHDGGSAIGQVLGLEVVRVDAGESGGARHTRVELRAASGHGVLLEPSAPFHDARLSPARPEDVEPALAIRGGRARLDVGGLARLSEVPFALDAGGFDRHTFFVGQSGSGKTYSLGVVLERLLAETTLRVVILDPNSDYVRLADLRPGADDPRYAAAAQEVVVRTPPRLRFDQLDATLQAALLRLDPIADAEEFAALARLLDEAGPRGLEQALRRAQSSGELGPLERRARNLGVEHLSVWAGATGHSVLDDLRDPAVRCLVVDLGGLPTRTEQALVGAAVLSELWRTRAVREPLLVVLDEAHNLAPAVPADALSAVAAARAVDIAAEGRKFGLYLLLSTQRPQKVAPDVLTQSDNAVVLRLNSDTDVAALHAALSFVPAGLLAQATSFVQGEAVIAGKIAPHPALVRFGARVSEENGADVPAGWAAVRAGTA